MKYARSAIELGVITLLRIAGIELVHPPLERIKHILPCAKLRVKLKTVVCGFGRDCFWHRDGRAKTRLHALNIASALQSPQSHECQRQCWPPSQQAVVAQNQDGLLRHVG